MDSSLLPRCLSLDLEVSKQNNRIHAFAAVHYGDDKPMVYRGGNLNSALARLDEYAAESDFLLGHNLISFDIPHLIAANPDLQILKLPAVDTLWLNPLAFPRNPYHHLVKHYQDGQLKRGRINDPELDARIVLEVLNDQFAALQKTPSELLTAWHYLTSMGPDSTGFDAVFTQLRSSLRPTRSAVTEAMSAQLDGSACEYHGQMVLNQEKLDGWSVAYALAWVSVSGGNSVMPPWVRHQFPRAGELVRLLRNTPCSKPDCAWCGERHDPRKELNRWFGFDDYRPDPKDDNGRPMQQVIVEAAMSRQHLLGILPTGTGKSLCYQIPAISRYDKTGALTIVISPLVALMEDQVSGLEAQGVGSCVAVNGLLSLPERKDALDRVRLGDVGILLISPEQLRSTAVRKVIDQREIGGWVLDEAHCLSKWGHDFRPDYRYVGRFIRERAGKTSIPPVMCLTATAKPDVVADIRQHFENHLGIELMVFDGGSHRTNLGFTVIPTTGGEKFSHIHQVINTYLSENTPGGAIVYCASRRQTEEIAEFLQDKNLTADFFHAGLPPDTKKDVQHRFIRGELRVITATNAFGMGIDKPDVRLVIHADIPGSLENYLQEAGRAGRDRQSAHCVLMYSPEDIEWQFGMSARSRLTRQEIHGVLRALRNLDRKKRLNGEVVATPGEILSEDEEYYFERDSITDDTRVRTAVSWLEESVLLTREENRVQVFPSSLRVNSVEEARRRLSSAKITDDYRKRLLSIAEMLIDADPDEGISTDELMGISGLSAERVRGAMYDLERLRIASNDTALTAYVHAGVAGSSEKRFSEAANLETNLISLMRDTAPDINVGERWPLHLRVAADLLRDRDVADPLPEKTWRIIRSIAADGRGENGDPGSLGVRRTNMDTVQVTLRRSWSDLEELASRRRSGAKSLLESLLSGLPQGRHGTDLLVETTLGKLLAAIKSDLFLESKKPEKLLDRALLWLHEQEVIRLHKGLAVFHPAMTIKLAEDRRSFTRADFEPLSLHYKGQVLQIHVMAEFALRGLEDMVEALRLAMDYFSLKQNDFLQRWLPNRDREIARETTPESWRDIVESLKNPTQQRIVADEREQVNMLVLAGPGSGKTRVLVHRIAYLVRVRRENPRGILALAYNRHAAVEIRRRLIELIGDDARGITVLTCHALAMRIVGVSFRERERRMSDDVKFREVLRQAVALLHGEGLEEEEANDQRDRLLAGFRWILVDEYQDIGEDQYELISALAGRTLQDEDRKLTLFAVGDDDQNIYTFNGASVEFIRRFEEDYGPKPEFLIENYRSTNHIIKAANSVIDSASKRMKSQHPICINRSRLKEPAGGIWDTIDPVSKGRVQILRASRNPVQQAQVAIKELERLATLSPDWNWSECAVIAREWKYLDPVRALCEVLQIPVTMGNEETPGFWHLRETRQFVDRLRGRGNRLVRSADFMECLDTDTTGPWIEMLQAALDEFALESGSGEVPLDHFLEWLAEWGREARRRQHGLLLLTAHRAKGLEFEHVVVLDGGWDKVDRDEDPDAPRRLFYVAMTRAKQTLATVCFQEPSAMGDSEQQNHVREPDSPVYAGDLRSLPFAFPNNGSILYRPLAETQTATRDLARQYRRPSLREVNLGYAGRFHSNHIVHRGISSLSNGDPLSTRITEHGSWELLDQEGTVVGRLAKAFEPPSGTQCTSASVYAIMSWSREASDPQYSEGMVCDLWEVVVPELVFEPESNSTCGPRR